MIHNPNFAIRPWCYGYRLEANRYRIDVPYTAMTDPEYFESVIGGIDGIEVFAVGRECSAKDITSPRDYRIRGLHELSLNVRSENL